jgi:DNA repair protein RadD
MAEWVRGVLTMDPRARILICTHVRELVAQNHAELMMLWPGAPAGIYSAGLRKRQLGSRILFCSVQSVHRRALQIQQCDMLLIDEAHLVPRDATTMYGRLIKELREINPAMKVIGYTATPYRMDQGLLYGPGEIFTHVAHETPVRLLIEQGFLVPLVSRSRKGVEINTTGVHTRLGEFVASELEEIALDPEVIERIADDIVANGHDRRGWLFFGVSIKHCELMNEALRDRGVLSAVISKDTPDDERARLITSYKNMAIRCLCSMGVLTTGFNAKHVDLIALARPTKSTGLYIQMVGRGTRCIGANIEESVANGKSELHGARLRRQHQAPRSVRRAVRAQRAQGPEGGRWRHPAQGVSRLPERGNDCDPVLPVLRLRVPAARAQGVNAGRLRADHGTAARMDAGGRGRYYRHEGRNGKPDTLKVNYRCGLTFHSEWLCFDAARLRLQKAQRWWDAARQGWGPAVPAQR